MTKKINDRNLLIIEREVCSNLFIVSRKVVSVNLSVFLITAKLNEPNYQVIISRLSLKKCSWPISNLYQLIFYMSLYSLCCICLSSRFFLSTSSLKYLNYTKLLRYSTMFDVQNLQIHLFQANTRIVYFPKVLQKYKIIVIMHIVSLII